MSGHRARSGARPRRRLHRAAGRGALGLIAMFFFTSAGMRLADGTGADALAGVLAWSAARAEGPASSPSVPEGARPETEGDEPDALLAAIARRIEALDAREAALEQRERAVEIAEVEIAASLAQLEAAETALRETVALADGAAADDLEQLTRMYETMKPKEAAALFAQMDPNFAAGFLGQMRPDAAAAIMAGLPPQTAYTVSLVLAGRNMRVPTE
jgi:flagellar motility protein MotE (MotC chaperone)